jgi:radical SAM superfamily enzyme YgiQ (UPF0313 family)
MMLPLTTLRRGSGGRTVTDPKFLLIGPYDPTRGEYTFLAPPLGVWRLAGVLTAKGIEAHVFDPNCCDTDPEAALQRLLAERRWDVIGISTTGMTLAYDLALAHLAKKCTPDACLIAGGMEATFDPETVLRLAPFDFVVLGEGEEPLLEMAARLGSGIDLTGIAGTAWRGADGQVHKQPRTALGREALRDAIAATPYEMMPYGRYWDRLNTSYRVGDLPIKAEREARLAEIRSARLITLNYCPMGCTFCASTNFLNEAQGGAIARLARLDEHEILSMVKRIVAAHPTVRTIIFQDDIFVFTRDARILPLCHELARAKATGGLPADLQFISTNRIDAMTPERLAALREAGFRVLGFGIESFSLEILREFNKAQIYPFIRPMLEETLRLGITPFLDMILTSPRCRIDDLADNIREASLWLAAGCEIGMYPYVIPFSGAAMARDASLRPYTVYMRRHIAGTDIEWQQPSKILPADPIARDMILAIETTFDARLSQLGDGCTHLPSRTRSLIWILSAIPLLRKTGFAMPSETVVTALLADRLPQRHVQGRALGASAKRVRRSQTAAVATSASGGGPLLQNVAGR